MFGGNYLSVAEAPRRQFSLGACKLFGHFFVRRRLLLFSARMSTLPLFYHALGGLRADTQTNSTHLVLENDGWLQNGEPTRHVAFRSFLDSPIFPFKMASPSKASPFPGGQLFPFSENKQQPIL